MTGGSGTGGPTTRRKSAVQDADRVFSRSSASFMRVRMSLAINPHLSLFLLSIYLPAISSTPPNLPYALG